MVRMTGKDIGSTAAMSLWSIFLTAAFCVFHVADQVGAISVESPTVATWISIAVIGIMTFGFMVSTVKSYAADWEPRLYVLALVLTIPLAAFLVIFAGYESFLNFSVEMLQLGFILIISALLLSPFVSVWIRKAVP